MSPGCGGGLAGSYGKDRRLFSLALFFLALQVSLASVLHSFEPTKRHRSTESWGSGSVGLMRASTLVGTSATRPLYPQKEGMCRTSVPVSTPSKPPGGRGSHRCMTHPQLCTTILNSENAMNVKRQWHSKSLPSAGWVGGFGSCHQEHWEFSSPLDTLEK